MDNNIDLFPFLWNRMNRENQSMPEYIGEFNGIDSLPKRDYPAVYYWVNKENYNNVMLSFNTPKLENWCTEEAIANGLNVDEIATNIDQALLTLQQVSTPAFKVMVNAMLNSEYNDQGNSNNSESNKWWKFW